MTGVQTCALPIWYYYIPYRCLVARDLDNLLMAGRNISTDVAAQSGVRLIMCCRTLGEAAGPAAAMSLDLDDSPADLPVPALQRELVRSGVNLGQGMRSIPGLSPAAQEDDPYANPELYTKKPVEAAWEGGSRKEDFDREEQYKKVLPNAKY